MNNYCDKCKSKIINGKCDCGIWIPLKKQPSYLEILEKSILVYNNMNINHPISGSHPSGTCFILFKGDYNLCEKIKEFIKKEKG